MQYKVVPFAAAIANHQAASAVAEQIQSLIASHVSNGWEYVDIHQLETFKAGSNGCFGLGATPSITTSVEFIVFRQ